MDESDLSDLVAQAGVRAHLRQIVIGEILRTMTPHEAEQAVSAAVQRLAQYVDEGPVQSIAEAVSQDKLQAMIDQVVAELQFMVSTLKRATA